MYPTIDFKSRRMMLGIASFLCVFSNISLAGPREDFGKKHIEMSLSFMDTCTKGINFARQCIKEDAAKIASDIFLYGPLPDHINRMRYIVHNYKFIQQCQKDRLRKLREDPIMLMIVGFSIASSVK